MSHHSSISSLSQCKYSLFHDSHGTSSSKLSLALHLRLASQSYFLATFILSSHPQITPCHESTLSTQLNSISSILWSSLEYQFWDQSNFDTNNPWSIRSHNFNIFIQWKSLMCETNWYLSKMPLLLFPRICQFFILSVSFWTQFSFAFHLSPTQ